MKETDLRLYDLRIYEECKVKGEENLFWLFVAMTILKLRVLGPVSRKSR